MSTENQSTAEDIIAAMGAAINEFQPFHNQILVATYISGNVKNLGGGHKLYLSDKTVDEDKWQGKVGLVLKKGPLAFANDSRNDFAGQNVDVGEWVMYRVSDGFAVDINGVHCRMIEDILIRGRVTSPKIIW